MRMTTLTPVPKDSITALTLANLFKDAELYAWLLKSKK